MSSAYSLIPIQLTLVPIAINDFHTLHISILSLTKVPGYTINLTIPIIPGTAG